MNFKKTEKEIIKAIVKYGGEVKSLVDVLNESQILEKRGIAIVPENSSINYIFLHKDKHDDEGREGVGYVMELLSLLETLIEKKLIVIVPFKDSPSPVIGKRNSQKQAPELISIDNGKESINLGYRNVNWCDSSGRQIYWTIHCAEKVIPINKNLISWFTISQELKDLVKNNFKTEEEIRFRKQQILTWVSIFIAFIIGLRGNICELWKYILGLI